MHNDEKQTDRKVIVLTPFPEICEESKKSWVIGLAPPKISRE